MSRFRDRANTLRERGGRGGRVFRPVFLICIMALACWGFWSNSQKRINALTLQTLFTDETQSVSAQQKEEVLALLKTFKKDFGVPLEMHIRKTPPALAAQGTTPVSDAQDASRIYIDIVPSQSRAYLFLPPLVRHAVGPAFIRDMERSFAQDFAAGDWRISLVPAILALRNKLAEVTR
jgi:hypothetical protein